MKGLIVVSLVALAACNPYNPADRALGGAAAGCGIGAIFGGPVGCGIGAGAGALGGVITTPPPPEYYHYYANFPLPVAKLSDPYAGCAVLAVDRSVLTNTCW